MDDTVKTISHLKLVKKEPLQFGKPVFKLPVLQLPEVKIPDIEFDARIKSNWARVAACELSEKRSNAKTSEFKRRQTSKLEMLLLVEDFLTKRKTSPTDREWADFIANNNHIYCKIVISVIEKYFPRLMPTNEAWDESIYLRRNTKYFNERKGTWKEPVMKAFVENIDNRQEKFQERGWVGEFERFTSKTKSRSVKTIALFLDYIEENFGISNLGALTQNHIDRYQAVSTFDIASLTRLIKLFQRKGVVDSKISVESVKWSPDVRKLLLPHEVSEITKKLLENNDINIIQQILVGLFILHYGQTASRVCKMNIKKLGLNNKKKWTICFGTVDLDIHPEIVKKLEIWLVERKRILEERGDPDNEFLFIDRRFLIPLNPGHLSYDIPVEGVDLKLWRTSAILNAYRMGIRRARILVDAFGISMPMAIRYQAVFGEVIRDEVTGKA